jgi:hypothetical protein
MEGDLRNNFTKKIRNQAKKVYEEVGITPEFQKVVQWQKLLKRLGLEEQDKAAHIWVVITVCTRLASY